MKRVCAALALFALALPGWAQDRVAVAGDGLRLDGLLFVPEGKGPYPAVVMLHGCSGTWDGRGRVNPSYAHWAEHLRKRGFAALLLDSFGPRGEKEICTQRDRAIRPERERSADAYAALRWLAARSDVDPSRIHVLGWSNGAAAVLHVVMPGAAGRTGDGHRFASAIAFYPGCRALLRGTYRPDMPLLIQAGGADDWTPAAHCEELARKVRQAGGELEIDTYPGAHHAFDRLTENVIYRPSVRNPSSKTGWGATVAGHAEAREKSWARAVDFLRKQGVPRGTNPGPAP